MMAEKRFGREVLEARQQLINGNSVDEGPLKSADVKFSSAGLLDPRGKEGHER